MKKRKVLYDEKLGKEWMDWVEKPNSEGSREQDIYPAIRNWLLETKPSVLVNVGCGQGICSVLVDKKASYIGIDPSPLLIKRANEKYNFSNAKFIEADAFEIPLEDGIADAVMSIWVWSHLNDLELAAIEMRRVLKPGGRFLIVTANPETYKERKSFYKFYKEKDGLLTGTFDLGNGKVLTNSTLYLHSKKKIEDSIINSGLAADSISRLGQLESYKKGLYLSIQGHKR